MTTKKKTTKRAGPRVNVNLSIPGTNVELGDLARDPISGFEGIVKSHTRHLTGCDSVWLEGETDKDGKAREFWVHVPMLQLVKKNPLNATPLPAVEVTG